MLGGRRRRRRPSSPCPPRELAAVADLAGVASAFHRLVAGDVGVAGGDLLLLGRLDVAHNGFQS